MLTSYRDRLGRESSRLSFIIGKKEYFQIWKEGRKEGRKEGKKEGKKEGRKGGFGGRSRAKRTEERKSLFSSNKSVIVEQKDGFSIEMDFEWELVPQ